MEVLERVGKETMEFIVEETGMEVDKGSTGEGDQQTEEGQFEEVSFDRCFYIYGGPDQLEVITLFSQGYCVFSFQYFLPFFSLSSVWSLFFPLAIGTGSTIKPLCIVV